MEYLIYSLEDDKDIAYIINKVLSKEGYLVESFYNAKDFYEGLREKTPEMILLDMMLPDTDGIEVLKDLRRNSKYDDVDIIIVSAKRMLVDKIDGLDLGADDYIEKPFDVLELMSRVNAKYRRYKKRNPDIISASGIQIDIKRHEISYKGEVIHFTPIEFQMLLILVKNKNTPVSRDMLLRDAYESRTVDMHIKSIRKKLNDLDGSIIKTIHGVGYMVME